MELLHHLSAARGFEGSVWAAIRRDMFVAAAPRGATTRHVAALGVSLTALRHLTQVPKRHHPSKTHPTTPASAPCGRRRRGTSCPRAPGSPRGTSRRTDAANNHINAYVITITLARNYAKCSYSRLARNDAYQIQLHLLEMIHMPCADGCRNAILLDRNYA